MIPGIAPAIITRTAGGGDALSVYYGSGEGDIVCDWDFSDPETMTFGVSDEGTTIETMINKGGYGSAHDLTANSNAPLYDAVSGAAISPSDRSKCGFEMASKLNMEGHTFLCVIKGRTAHMMADGWANPATRFTEEANYSRVRAGHGTPHILHLSGYTIDTHLLVESRAINGESAAWAQITSTRAGTYDTNKNMTYGFVGGTVNQGDFPDWIKRLIVIKADSNHDHLDLEPAHLAARDYLWGIVEGLNA